MEIVCKFRNIQEMAQDVNRSAELIEGRKFSPRPWNRFDPERSDWWIVPSTDWPAYRYGKGMFKPTKLFPGHVLCCLNVEKGFGHIVAEAYPQLTKAGHIIDEHWAWFDFLKGLEDGSIARAVQVVAQATNKPVILEISAGYPGSPGDFEPHSLLQCGELEEEECRSEADGGLVGFTVGGDALEKLEERCIRDVMVPVVECRRLSELPRAFQSTSELPWAWIDVYIGTLILLAPDAQVARTYWGASEIWHKLLHPWVRWII